MQQGPPSKQMVAEALTRHKEAKELADTKKTSDGFLGVEKSKSVEIPKIIDPKHNFALINLSHVNHKKPSSSKPQFRLLGNYVSESATTKPIKRIQKFYNCCHVYRIPTKKFVLIAESEKLQNDKQYCTDKINRLIDLHMKRNQENKDDFERNRKATEQEKSGLITQLKEKEAKKSKVLESQQELFKKKSDQNKDSKEQTDEDDIDNFPSSLEPRGQRFAIVTLLPDYEREFKADELPEPALCVFDSFAEKDTAQAYSEHYLGPLLPDYSLFVVDMYTWANALDAFSKDIPTKWRQDKLSNIMNHHSAEQALVKKVKEEHDKKSK